jgi:hypothetical protein
LETFTLKFKSIANSDKKAGREVKENPETKDSETKLPEQSSMETSSTKTEPSVIIEELLKEHEQKKNVSLN